MKISWYLNRIRSMSIKEILFYRTFQFLNRHLFLRIKLVFFKPSNIFVNPNYKGPNYSNEEIDKLFKLNHWNNEYSFFDTTINLGNTISWRKDYKNGINSEIKFCNKIKKQDFIINGDVKYISELSRLHFLPFLAFKTINDNNLKDKSIYDILKRWEEDNPFMMSINYTSGIEVAIRSVNLTYTYHILNSFNILTEKTGNLIKKLISQNYFFLKNNLSLYSSSNNHLIAELTGLVVISTYFKGKKFSLIKWKQKLLDKITTKYNGDGIDDELSFRYHLAVSDHFINSLQFIRNIDSKISKSIIQRLIEIQEFTSHINYFDIDSNFGDNDGSFLINPFFDNNFSFSKSILESFNIICNESRKNESVDFRNYLIFGDKLLSVKKDLNKLFFNQSTIFKESGYAFLYDNKKDLKLTFDFGNIGDNKLMAHGHSDQLSLTLQKNNCEILVDPGTYQYHETKSKWRQYFRSIKAHNCISFNGMNHALSLGRMSWTNSSKVTNKSFRFSDKIDKVLGKTDAFINQELDYSREITLDKELSKISIIDKLIYSSKKSGTASFYLHFHPNLNIYHNQNIINIKTQNGDSIKIENPIFKTAKLLKGNMEIPFGWYSDKYDVKQESFSLISEFIVKKDVIITTEIFY